MGYRRLFIMRKDLNMSAGKLAAQVGHCAEGYWTMIIRNSTNPQLIDLNDLDSRYYNVGFELDKNIYEQYINGSFVKTICEARNKNHLLKAKMMANEMGFSEGIDYGLIYDSCLTELEPEEENGTTLTGIWFRPLPDEIAHQISKKYQLYK